jgi:hypothetical protein
MSVISEDIKTPMMTLESNVKFKKSNVKAKYMSRKCFGALIYFIVYSIKTIRMMNSIEDTTI